MEDILDFLTEEQRKLHEEFTQCQDWGEVEAFLKKVEKLNESRDNNEILHLDMTIEEFRAKYHTKPLKEILDKYGF